MSTGSGRERHAATHTREVSPASEGREGRVTTSHPRRPACASSPTPAACGLCGDEIHTSRDVWIYCHGRPEHSACHALECTVGRLGVPHDPCSTGVIRTAGERNSHTRELGGFYRWVGLSKGQAHPHDPLTPVSQGTAGEVTRCLGGSKHSGAVR